MFIISERYFYTVYIFVYGKALICQLFFRRSCLGSLLTHVLSWILANEIRCNKKCLKFQFKNKLLCDKLKSVTYTGTCSRWNVYGSNNRTRLENTYYGLRSYSDFLIKVFTTVRLQGEKNLFFYSFIVFFKTDLWWLGVGVLFKLSLE